MFSNFFMVMFAKQYKSFIFFDELIFFLLLIGIVYEWIFNHAVQNGQVRNKANILMFM